MAVRIALRVAAAGAAIYAALASPAPADEATAFLMDPLARHTGDLAQMRQHKVVRALVALNRTGFFFIKGQPRGFEYELLRQYEKALNQDVAKGKIETRIVYVPVPFNALLPALEAGIGDIAAAGLTITPERQELVAFSEPYLPSVDEVVVASPAADDLETLEDLAGRRIYVLRASSYASHLRDLSRALQEDGLPPIEIVEADENLATEDILEMVNAGVVDLTIADSHLAELWSRVLPEITVRDDLAINAGGQIAWAVRKSSPELRASLDAFILSHRQGSLIGNVLFERYYQTTDFITNPLAEKALEKLDGIRPLFEQYGTQYGFDPLLVAAQAYQESGFDQGKRSPAGAIGIMQIRPRTAADPQIGIADIEKLENNVHAGVKYARFLRDRYFADPAIEGNDRLSLTLAAYNAGPRKIARVRQRAAKMGLDPNVWFRNVEMAALDLIGQETVRYVSNIHKYYVAYRLAFENAQRRTVQLEELRTQ